MHNLLYGRMTIDTDPRSAPGEGWRDRKRGQTRRRIAEAGLRLFLDEGFDATTLDAIAEAACIARRTFFHYFDSKDALLSAFADEAEQSFRAALARTPGTVAPFDAMRSAILDMVADFGTDRARAIDRLMRSTDALRARRQADYERLERFVGETLAQRWPDPAYRLRLRTIAMAGIGTLRIAADRWNAGQDTCRIQDYLDEGFSALADALSSQASPLRTV